MLALRSVPEDGRQLLYSRVTAAGLPPGLRPALEWTLPNPVIINRFLVATPVT